MKKNWLFIFICLAAINGFAQTLQVMTYNIRLDTKSDGENQWNKRKNYLAKQILFYSPDLLGIQEGLPQQVDFLDSILTNYSYTGVGRDDGKRQGEFSAIFYNNEKLTLLEQSTFWLSETPDIVSKGWDAAIVRICTYVLFEFKNENIRFWVFNTHFDHIGEMAREKSAELIWQKINEINVQNYPVILTGDFNSEPTAKPILFLSSQMQESFSSAPFTFGPDGTFNNFEFDKPVKNRIDYVFTSKNNWRVLSHAILSDSKDGRYPSDHLPVLVKISLDQ